MVATGGGCGVVSGGESVIWAVVPGGRTGIPGFEDRLLGAEVIIAGAGVKTFLLSAECWHLPREVLDHLQKYSVVWGWANASELRLE